MGRGRFDSYPLRFAATLAGAALLLLTRPASADRTFDFTYQAQIKGLPADKTVRIWLPEPKTTPDQTVSVLERKFPSPATETVDAAGNKMFYVESAAPADGVLQFSVTYHVVRQEVSGQPVDDADVARYLKPDRLVPVGGKPAALLEHLTLPPADSDLARRLYDLVDDRMQYRKDKPGWGRGDANWACDSRFGNCTDFHSLFMSLARTKHLPAKFEIGFSVPKDDQPAAVTGYHCWAFFKPADRHAWVPVDISEANKDPAKRDYYFGHLDADRVTFSTGRDLVLSPPQAGPPLNFFIYPYAEVDGRPCPSEAITHSFRFEPAQPTRTPR